ncbi:hypothetical protein RHMOL_Rhmol07G0092800 [Rhododendron molle]|uniref:Uncharacterized protein n=1 Tax=Rhododendron molle TaxID=49168 RepID=A0ACC0MYN6_RHOML|nr:hypothetical protein RHMOL_Rhmol07G0092800 [Rhododendron molle]
MELFYYLVFGGFGVVVLALELSKTSRDRINNTPAAFNSFKNNYLFVYSLMMGMLSREQFCSPSPKEGERYPPTSGADIDDRTRSLFKTIF